MCPPHRVTIRGAQPSARLSEEICLSEGSARLSQGSAEVSPRVLRGSAGFWGGPRDFPRFLGGSGPMLATIRNCWTKNRKIRKIYPDLYIYIWGLRGALYLKFLIFGHRKSDTKPQPDMRQRTLLSPHHGQERRETCGVLPFSKQ